MPNPAAAYLLVSGALNPEGQCLLLVLSGLRAEQAGTSDRHPPRFDCPTVLTAPAVDRPLMSPCLAFSMELLALATIIQFSILGHSKPIILQKRKERYCKIAMVNRQKSDKPLTIIGIEWRRSCPEDDPQAVRVRFDYSIRDNRTGEQRVSGRRELEIPPMLAPFNDDLLINFFTLRTSGDIADAIRELSDDPDQESVVLKTGTLASLLRYCITPEEAWSFILNHGDVSRTSAALIDADSGPLGLRAYEHTLSGALTRTRLKKAVAMCKGTAKALTKVQQISVVPELGPIPPLAPEPTANLITDLKFVAESLAGYLPIFTHAAHRPANPLKMLFCRDWYHLALEAVNAVVRGEPADNSDFALSCRSFSPVYRTDIELFRQSILPQMGCSNINGENGFYTLSHFVISSARRLGPPSSGCGYARLTRGRGCHVLPVIGRIWRQTPHGFSVRKSG
jgi:hypothetical protein